MECGVRLVYFIDLKSVSRNYAMRLRYLSILE